MQDLTREELLALTPERYLAAGYFDSQGQLRRELRGEYATAASTQLMAAELSPQELGLTVEGIVQILPMRDEPTAVQRLLGAIEEALMVVARALQQANNEGMVEWLIGCASAVRKEADVAAFIAHLQVVNRQYAILVALQPPDSPSSLVH